MKPNYCMHKDPWTARIIGEDVMIKVLAEVWIHSNAETGEPCEVSIAKIKSDEFLCFDFLRFFLEYDFDDRIDEFNFLKLDEWHVIELYFEYEDGWYFECAKNT